MSATPVSWHLDDALASRYAHDGLDPVAAASVEAHLLGCARCRAALAPWGPPPSRLERVWADVADAVDVPRPTVAERVLRRLGVHATEARLLAATPSLQASWFAALLLVLGFAVAAAHGLDRSGVLFLLVAPVLPVAGVGWAYGPGVDPAYEIGAAAPYSAARLLLLRAASVLTVCVLLATLSAALLPSTGWKQAAWLLPALALTSATLALSTRLTPAVAAGAVGAVWCALVLQLARHERSYDAVGPTAQGVALVVLVVATALLLLRNDRLDHGSPA